MVQKIEEVLNLILYSYTNVVFNVFNMDQFSCSLFFFKGYRRHRILEMQKNNPDKKVIIDFNFDFKSFQRRVMNYKTNNF